MTATITNAGINMVLNALTDKTAENPFLKMNDKTYVRFDSISIDPTSSNRNEFTVYFSWKGERLLELPSRLIRFDQGDVLTIQGLEGRMEFNLKGD